MLRTPTRTASPARGEQLAPAERRVARAVASTSGPKRRCSPRPRSAEQLGTSDATVVRTAKALGYSGLAELRRALATYGDNPPLRRTAAPHARTGAGRRALHRRDPQPPRRARKPDVATSHPRRSKPRSRSWRGCDRVVWRGVGPSAHLAAVRTTHHAADREAELRARPHRDVVRRRAPDARTERRDRRVRLRPAPVARSCAPRPSRRRSTCPSSSSPTRSTADSKAPSSATLQCGRGAPGLFASHAHHPRGRRSARARDRGNPASGIRIEPGEPQRTPRRARRPPHRRRHP